MQLGPQELELQVVVGCHVDPLGGQTELLAAEPTLQPQNMANSELYSESVCKKHSPKVSI